MGFYLLQRGCANIFLKSCSRLLNAGDDMIFIAQNVLQDIEEFCNYPFGDPIATEVVAGHGGKEGLKMLKRGGESIKTLADALTMIVKAVNTPAVGIPAVGIPAVDATAVNKKNQDILAGIEGWERLEGEDFLRNKLNGRPFSFPDAEHILCKSYVMASYTLGGRMFSERPQATKPYLHPIQFHHMGPPWDHQDILDRIVQPGIDVFHSCVDDRSLVFPDFCMLSIEAEQAENYRKEKAEEAARNKGTETTETATEALQTGADDAVTMDFDSENVTNATAV